MWFYKVSIPSLWGFCEVFCNSIPERGLGFPCSQHAGEKRNWFLECRPVLQCGDRSPLRGCLSGQLADSCVLKTYENLWVSGKK